MNFFKIAIFTLLNIILCSSNAQQIDSLRLVKLDEVVVSVNKEVESKKSVAQDIQVLNNMEIQNSQASTTADVLSNAGIHIQRSQLGGGSPVLRGFEASRIVLMMDGVRLNNLIYRGGHLQDVIKTDNNSLERIEILYGPSSTIYGSDALGGVIHLYTKKPMLSETGKPTFNLNVFSRYQSAANALTEHLDFNIGGKNISSFTSLSYSKYEDLLSGKNQNPFYTEEYGTRPFYVGSIGKGKDTLIKNSNRFLQVGSGYSQYDLVQKVLFRQNNHLTHSLNIQFSNSSDVPRYDRLTDPSATTGLRSAEWYYGPQSRLLTAYNLDMKKSGKLFDELHLGLNYQKLEESRHNRNFNSSSLNHRIENVNVFGASLDFIKKSKDKHSIRYGLDVQLNSLKSTANKENIVTNTIGKLDTRYPDGDNTMNNFALYFSHTWKLNPQISIVDGFRAGFSNLHSTLVDTALLFHLPYTDVKQNTPVYSGSIGLIHSPSDDLKLSFLLSTGYRVPNVDDLSKIFGSSPGMVIVPNKDLKPERTINYEFGMTKIFNNKTRWENSIFFTDYRDIAVVDEFKFNGQDSILYDGNLSKVFANQNKDRAFIYGFSSNLFSQLDEHFSCNVGINYTYGRIKTELKDNPLDHIPPFIARASARYVYSKFSSDFFILYNGWKKIKNYYLNGEDNEQYATPEGMPAWFTVNLRCSYQVHKFVSLQAGVDNMLDTQYRKFASGINSPGRNFIIALKGSF